MSFPARLQPNWILIRPANSKSSPSIRTFLRWSGKPWKAFPPRGHKPSCICISHKAAHDPRTPAVRHSKLFEGKEYPLPKSANYNLEGKPEWLREKSPLAKGNRFPADPERYQEGIRNYFRTLVAVDEGVGQVLATLEKIGELDNTAVIFCGDNGYFFGEHGLGDKRKAYEESIRIPFLIRYPKLAKPGTVVDEMVLNIDLAPTLLDLAGVAIPSIIQGRSLKPLLEGRKPRWREEFLYEYFVDAEYPKNTPKIHAVRTRDWKYISYPELNDVEELYDLRNDPYEMRNLAQDPRYARKLREMKSRLARLLEETK